MLKFICKDGTGPSAQVVDAKTGEDLQEILQLEYGVQITIGPIVTARATIACVETELAVGKAEFRMRNPINREYEPVAAIEFRDGARVEIDEDGTPHVKRAATTDK